MYRPSNPAAPVIIEIGIWLFLFIILHYAGSKYFNIFIITIINITFKRFYINLKKIFCVFSFRIQIMII